MVFNLCMFEWFPHVACHRNPNCFPSFRRSPWFFFLIQVALLASTIVISLFWCRGFSLCCQNSLTNIHPSTGSRWMASEHHHRGSWHRERDRGTDNWTLRSMCLRVWQRCHVSAGEVTLFNPCTVAGWWRGMSPPPQWWIGGGVLSLIMFHILENLCWLFFSPQLSRCLAEGFRRRTFASSLGPPQNPTTWMTWDRVPYMPKHSQATVQQKVHMA